MSKVQDKVKQDLVEILVNYHSQYECFFDEVNQGLLPNGVPRPDSKEFADKILALHAPGLVVKKRCVYSCNAPYACHPAPFPNCDRNGNSIRPATLADVLVGNFEKEEV